MQSILLLDLAHYHIQLEQQRVITPVNGTDYNTPLPSGLFPTVEQFESPEKLVAWANEIKAEAKLIQKGLQKGIIEVRACFKSCPKDETWTESMGIANVTKMEWKIVDRPNSGSSKVKLAAKLEAGLEIAQAMKDSKANTDLILMALTPTYGKDGAQAIINTLT